MMFLLLSSIFLLSNAVEISLQPIVEKTLVKNVSSPDIMSAVKNNPKDLIKMLENADPEKVQAVIILVQEMLSIAQTELARLNTVSTDATAAYDAAVVTYDAAVVAETEGNQALAAATSAALSAKDTAFGAMTAGEAGLNAGSTALENEISTLQQVITMLEGLLGSTGAFDFESGILDGWTLTGTAFDNQPTYGDNPTARSRGQISNHEGNWWIGGYENCNAESSCPNGHTQGDGPIGTATSPSFRLTGTSASFLIGGGNYEGINAELIVDGAVVRKSHGNNNEHMQRQTWDISQWTGQMAELKLSDLSSGGWGHINFDDWQQA